MITQGKQQRRYWTTTPIVAILAAVMLASAVASPVYGLTFEPAINLSYNSTPSTEPVVASEGNHVYVAWTDVVNGNSIVFFKRSTDGGDTFQPRKNLGAADYYVSMVASGSNVFLVWNSAGEVRFKRSIDNGSTFGSTITLGTGYGRPELAVSGSYIFVVWGDNDSTIFFKRSTNSGASFEATKKVFELKSGGEVLGAKVAFSGGNVVVTAVYNDPQSHSTLLSWTSNDAGASFPLNGVPLSSTGQNVLVGSQSFAVQGDFVYLLWTENGDLWFTRSTSSGVAFEDARRLSTGNIGGVPKLAVSGVNVYTAWDEQAIYDGPKYAYFKRSTDNGGNFEARKTIGTNSTIVDLEASGSAVHALLGADVSGIPDVFVKSSTDNGASFAIRKHMSNSPDAYSYPGQLAVSGSTLHVVWAEYYFTSGNSDVFFRKGT